MHYLRPHLVDGACLKLNPPSAADGYSNVQRGHGDSCWEEGANTTIRPLSVVPQGVNIVCLEQHIACWKEKVRVVHIKKETIISLSSYILG